MSAPGRTTLRQMAATIVTFFSMLLSGCESLPLPEACDRGGEDPTQSETASRLTKISAGATHTCVVTNEKQLSCWGGNITATLGDGTLLSRSAPIKVSGLSNVSTVGAGAQSTCAVLESGEVLCWGIPLMESPEPFIETPMPIKGISGAVEVSVGTNHGCALLRTGRVQCFGDNSESQLGSGGASDRGPLEVQGIENGTAISVGGRTTCITLQDGSVQCWGNNDFSQLGDGSTQRRREPGLVQGVLSAVDVSVSEHHACALQSDGTIWCWGRNDHGQLGAPRESSVGWPRQVDGLTGVSSVETGEGFTCVTLQNGTVRCFGVDTGSHPGGGDETILPSSHHEPTQIEGIAGAAAVTSGAIHACALLRDGGVRCWGNNLVGQLGDGIPLERTSAVPAKGLSAVTALSSNRDHTCAATKSGHVTCWGRVWPRGFLGEPTQIDGVDQARDVAVGSFHGCAITEAGEVRCWGGNDHGQLGDGTTDNRPTAVPVSGLTKVTELSAGERHSCAVVESGEARCWGENDEHSQLGDGTWTMQTSPRPVLNIPEVAWIAAASSKLVFGGGRTCAISRGAGKLICWGRDTWANVPDRFAKLLADEAPSEQEIQALRDQLEGNSPQDEGGESQEEAPLPIAPPPPDEPPEPHVYTNPSSVTKVAVSSCNTCVVTREGTVQCWANVGESQAASPVPGLSDVRDIAVSGNSCIEGGGPYSSGHACALLADGRVMCWGRNGIGQLGDGSTEERASPVEVQGVANAVAITAGIFHSCALVQSGAVLCWGNDSWGQLGTGRLLASSAPIVVTLP